MIIGERRVTHENGEICVSADVRLETPGVDVPKTLWFRFPEEYRNYISERSDAFAVAMLSVAMLLGEDIVVEGTVSPRLAHGIRQYQTAYTQWWPRKLTHVGITYGEVATGAQRRAGNAVGGTCSGGVDSFYSVWKHMPMNESLEASRLTHCLIVNGFTWDMDLDKSGEFQQVIDTYAPLLRRLGIELLVARHNWQVFLQAAEKARSKTPTHETGIISSVLMLGNLFERFFLSGVATYRYEDCYPHGYHPSAMHWLSSEDTEMSFDGGDATRTERTLTISRWEETYSTLRVCWRPTVFNEDTGMIENCCKCPKCLRTMITLDVAGALSKYRTFPEPLDRRLVRASHHVGVDEKLYYFDLLEFARKMGRADMVRDLRYARFRSRLRAAIRSRLLRWGKRGH